MEPATSIVRILGGPTAVARIADVHRTRVHSWMRSRPQGTGGIIPHWHVGKLLTHARAHDIPLTEASFAPVFESMA